MTQEIRSITQLLNDWAAVVAGTELPPPPPYDGPALTLSGLVEHSGQVTPGSAFIARVRAGSDGHRYIAQAAANGARLIVGQRPPAELDVALPDTVVYWQVADTALTLAWLAAAWHGFPSRQLVVVGVTGTDGKTTTSNMLYYMLRAAGRRAGLLSTVQALIGDRAETLALHVTTPEAPVIQAYLRRMVDAGVTHCILESTSHGLAQHRVAAVDFDVAVVTNITHEHLDYHGDYDGYFAAKARLFQALNRPPADHQRFPLAPAKKAQRKTAVLNMDDSSFARLQAIGLPRLLSYAIDAPADVRATAIETLGSGTRFDMLLLDEQSRRMRSSMVGYFNVYNMLAAAAAACALGLGGADIQQGLANLPGITGRMEKVDAGQAFLVIVDFAHTPEGLRQALTTARRILTQEGKNGRVIAVFGSAGKRDVAKRRLMAEISAQTADLSVLTAEDPRTESLQQILAMMAEGCVSQGAVEGETFWRVPDRGRAIHFALSLAQPDDLVIICGKAHEQSMCFDTTEYPWDDLVATRTALEAYQSGRSMPDLGLPTYAGDWK